MRSKHTDMDSGQLGTLAVDIADRIQRVPEHQLADLYLLIGYQLNVGTRQSDYFMLLQSAMRSNDTVLCTVPFGKEKT